MKTSGTYVKYIPTNGNAPASIRGGPGSALLPQNAIVFDGMIGDSQIAGLTAGSTLDDGTTATVGDPAGQIWSKWNAVTSTARIDTSTDPSHAPVPVTIGLGATSPNDIGPEVSYCSEMAEYYGRLGVQHCLLKCAVPGTVASGGIAGAPFRDLDPFAADSLYAGFIEGHLKPAAQWARDNQLIPYFGGIVLGAGGNDAASEQGSSLYAQGIQKAIRGIRNDLGGPARIVIPFPPADLPESVAPFLSVVRDVLGTTYRGHLLYYRSLSRRSDDQVHLTASGQLEFGLLLAKRMQRQRGRILKIDL